MPPRDRDTEIAALLPSVYRELRRIANANMARLPAGTTLQPTALVHEAWLRLGGSGKASWQSRAHFMAAAAEAMRHILIDRARAGSYTQFEVQRGLAIGQTIKYFEEAGDGWRAVEQLRRPVRFQVHNVLEQPPHPGAFDIVLCRNVLLYLSPDKRALAFERLVASMAEDGWLMLGAGETVIGQTNRLCADVNARGLYRLVGDERRVEKRTGADRRAAGGA